MEGDLGGESCEDAYVSYERLREMVIESARIGHFCTVLNSYENQCGRPYCNGCTRCVSFCNECVWPWVPLCTDMENILTNVTNVFELMR